MYSPIGGDVYEFIELKNISELPVNVGLFSISGEITYNFPPNTIFTPGQVIVLASDNNPIAFTNRYPQLRCLDGLMVNSIMQVVVYTLKMRQVGLLVWLNTMMRWLVYTC
jgi:hypothetical protein